MFGEDILEARWRPLEAPHHSITPQAMVGGGSPIFPGVISRAHGGFLVMDEFLEYHPMVLEALREPIESGYIIHARRGDRLRFPANFQLIATSNLCPCGKLNPVPNATIHRDCRIRLNRCASVLRRLSGPIMDRFDILQITNSWLHRGERISWLKIRDTVDAARAFRQQRGVVKDILPDWLRDLGHSHRRSQSLLRVARALADLRESPAIESTDFQQAYERVVVPMEALRQYFA
jgi:magnesium chelatase family protein